MGQDSLQDKKRTGGLYGARGYEFEKSYILSQLPDWLASIDLEFFQQELWSDLELFFRSGKRWLVQIKNHPIELSEFRGIVLDFQTRSQTSRDIYERYVLISTGSSNSVREIQNIVERWSSIEHLGEAELKTTKAHNLAKLADAGFSDVAQFLLDNSKKLRLIFDAGWINDEITVRKIFVSRLTTDYKIDPGNADELYFRLTQRLNVERGKRVDLLPLREEVNALPSREVASSPSAVPFILPQLDISTFTGRDSELTKLEALLLGGDSTRVCSIVGVAGSGGIGKSALACHFAELHKAAFPDGVIGLRVDGKDNDAIAREFARLTSEEIDPDDDRDAASIMQEVFSHRRMLLIFDNAEDATIEFLRPGGNSCAVIITTRDRQLPSLLDVPDAGQIDLPPLLLAEARTLLEELIGKDRVAAEQTSVDEIIRLVGSLPLALQIIGASLQMQIDRSLASYAGSLKEERERLEKLKVRGAAHLDVRASFTLSLNLLQEAEIDFFACLSVCALDGFSLQGAIAAGGCGETEAHEWLGYLFRLSLLNRPQLASVRYVFHPLIRVFAQEIADKRSLRDNAAARHADFFVHMVKESDLGDQQAAEVITTEIDDIILAAEWLQRQQLPDYRFVISLEPFLQRNGYWHQATRLMAGFLTLAESQGDWTAVVQLRIQEAKYLSLRGAWRDAEDSLDVIPGLIDRIQIPEVRQRHEAMFLNSQGGVLQRLGRFDEAAEVLRRGSEIEQRLGNLGGQAKVLNSLGSVLQRIGAFEEAITAFRKSAEIEEELGNRRGQAMTLNSLGSVLQRQGHFKEAVDAFRASHDLLVKLGDLHGQAMVLTSLGGVLQRQGQFDEAIQVLGQSAVIEDSLGNQRGQAMVLTSLGGVFQRQGRFPEAVDAFQRSAEIEEKLGNERGQAMVLNSLGGVLQRQGHFKEAVDAFRTSHDLLVKLGDLHGQAMVLNSLGGVFQRQGRFPEAVVAFQRSYEISERLKDNRSLAMVLNSLGVVFQRQGKLPEAVDVFQRSVKIGNELDDRRHMAMALNSLGGVFERQRKFDEALNAFERSYAISKAANDLVSLAMVHFGFGKTRLALGDAEAAVADLRTSFEINEQLAIQRGIAIVTPWLIRLLRRLGRYQDAIDFCDRAIEVAPTNKRLRDLRSELS